MERRFSSCRGYKERGGALVPPKRSAAEVVAMLREIEKLTGEGMPVSAAASRLGITDKTYYRWRAHYGSMPEEEASHLQTLEHENARLKRLAAEQARDISMLREMFGWQNLSPAQRREAVDHLVHHFAISERRACTLVGQNRSTQRYDAASSEGAPASPTNRNGSDLGALGGSSPTGVSATRTPCLLGERMRVGMIRAVGVRDELTRLALDSPVARAVGVPALAKGVERLLPRTPRRMVGFLCGCPQRGGD
jgi:transposase